MSYEMRADYAKQWLMPPALEDWVPADHPARFIREVVDALDLAADGVTQRTSVEGRPSYASDLLLKVWLYGYLNGIRQTRRLERACREHLSLLWLTGLNDPDHNTLWRFWRDNRAALRRVFKRVVRVAARANLVGLVLHAIDGTKIAAQASKQALWTREQLAQVLAQLAEMVEEGMQQIERAEVAAGPSPGYRLPPTWEEAAVRREQVRELLEELLASERDTLHPLEREARLMKPRGGMAPAYNAQAVVDATSGVIVAAEVTTEASDNYQLVPMLDQVEETLGAVAEETLADGGYYAPQTVAQAAESGYPVLVNEGQQRAPSPAAPHSEFHASRFTYEPEHDRCVCPRGQGLELEGERPARRHRDAVRIYRCRHYQGCPVRWQCSARKYGRRIEIGKYHAAVVAQRLKQGTPAKRALLARRKVIAEPPFGTIKETHGFRRWTVAGLDNVRTQWALICTAFNLHKLYAAWRHGQLAFAS